LKKEFDTKKIESLLGQLLVEFGDDVQREGLKDTPKRATKMFAEMLVGMRYSNAEIAKLFDKTFEQSVSNDLVLVKDIECFSFCEHHIALMYDMKIAVGYIPNGRVIGLSKIARICDMVCRRLQLQERIGSDIASIMQQICKTQDVIVVIEAKHSCMSARGIQNKSAKTRTAALRGIFETDVPLRQEVYGLLKN